MTADKAKTPFNIYPIFYISISRDQKSTSIWRIKLRTLRNTLNVGFPLAGVFAVLSAVLFLNDIRAQIALVVFGIILIEAGVWKLSYQILPNERQYHHLRSEIDTFIELCRQLNTSAIILKAEMSYENQQNFDNIKTDLEQTLERIIRYAGKTEQDLLGLNEYIHGNV